MKIIDVLTDAGSADSIASVAEKYEAIDFRTGLQREDGLQEMRLLVTNDKTQNVLDTLQSLLGGQPHARVIVTNVETSLPKPTEETGKGEKKSGITREALYANVEKSVQLDINFVSLTFLSTIVAILGLVEDNVAVIIGAMVIAPLLGPNLALALGATLGDVKLIRKAVVTNVSGLSIALVMSIITGLLLPEGNYSEELLARTNVGLDSIALALASGAAATLSLTTGLSSVLVGVMVAVALLPPAATFGIMLGTGQMDYAIGAGLLLAVNVVSVNLAAKTVFLLKGIQPRTWWEKEKARSAMKVHFMIWITTLIILILAIYAIQTIAE